MVRRITFHVTNLGASADDDSNGSRRSRGTKEFATCFDGPT